MKEAALYRTVENSPSACRKRDCGRKTAATCHGSDTNATFFKVAERPLDNSLEISDRTTSTVTFVLRGDHRPSTFRAHNFSPSPSHRTIRRNVKWAADSMVRLTINTCTYIPEMSRCTEHQFVTQTSERQTDRTHTHAADNPLSTLLNSLMDCAAPTSVLRCSSTRGLHALLSHTLTTSGAAVRYCWCVENARLFAMPVQ